MLGKYMEFWVTPKIRKNITNQDSGAAVEERAKIT
jgi:hypothetical protein